MTISNQKIYTTGYTGKKVVELPALLDTLEAVLIDIRFSPKSREIVWSRDYLELLLKRRYLHVGALGNRQFREGTVQIQNLRLGMKVIQSLAVNVLLMCGCEDLYQCHRLIIMNEFRKTGFEVSEIENWKTDKPTLFPT